MLFLLFALLAFSSALQVVPKAHFAPNSNVTGEECSTCIEAAVMEINVLLNEILNGVIVTDCATFCSTLPNQWEADGCEVVCLFFGIGGFVDLLTSADIDPIWYCEILDACTIDDCQGDCLDITDYETIPPKAKAGVVLNQMFTVDIKQKWAGTGMFRFILYDPVQGPQESDNLIDGGFGPVGNNTYSVQLDTSDQGFGLAPGTYITQIFICNGECGSQHPHSRVFSTMNSSFTLTASSEDEESL